MDWNTNEACLRNDSVRNAQTRRLLHVLICGATPPARQPKPELILKPTETPQPSLAKTVSMSQLDSYIDINCYGLCKWTVYTPIYSKGPKVWDNFIKMFFNS